jgi:hypothetical protein
MLGEIPTRHFICLQKFSVVVAEKKIISAVTAEIIFISCVPHVLNKSVFTVYEISLEILDFS